jgi:hypothetical protein
MGTQIEAVTWLVPQTIHFTIISYEIGRLFANYSRIAHSKEQEIGNNQRMSVCIDHLIASDEAMKSSGLSRKEHYVALKKSLKKLELL